MEEERISKIKVGDVEYELILTTKATKEIASRYGGLENLGEKLMKAENLIAYTEKSKMGIAITILMQTLIYRFLIAGRVHHQAFGITGRISV